MREKKAGEGKTSKISTLDTPTEQPQRSQPVSIAVRMHTNTMTTASDDNNKGKSSLLTTSSSSSLQVLALLEEYEACHNQGNGLWKQSLWNLYKGRHLRKRHNLAYGADTYCCASNLREHGNLDPRLTVLVEASSNSMDDEDDDSADSDDKNPSSRNSVKEPPSFICVKDGVVVVDDRKNSNSNQNENDPPPALSMEEVEEERNMIGSSDGLRNRRQRPSTSTTTIMKQLKEEEDNKEPMTSTNAHHHRWIDPLELLAGGLPPKELRLAQTQAQEAVQSYIRAANAWLQLQSLVLGPGTSPSSPPPPTS